MENQKYLKRYFAPNKYDQAPYGTKCLVVTGEEAEVYIQYSQDEENPNWIHLGKHKDDNSTIHT